MQRVSSFLPSWDRRHSGSGSIKGRVTSGGAPTTTAGLFGWSNRSSTSTTASAGAQTSYGLGRINTDAANRLSTRTSISTGKVQREAFWPATLDIECDKAARIVKSFCADGFLATPDDDNNDDPTSTATTTDTPKSPVKIRKKIPRRIIQDAAGIAVFSCMRSGLWMTGSGGSGILIARKSDGTWSPPSGIMLHTPTLSFIIGVDVYDCVLIVNSLPALEALTRPSVTLGEDVALTNGLSVPVDSNGADFDARDLGNTVLAYMKARGQEQAVNLNGCILTERSNENERFYSSGVSQMDILSGHVGRHVEQTQPLFEVIKMAEGRTDFDPVVISKITVEPAPGDAMIMSPGTSVPASPRRPFGLASPDDPDPFGILALEMAGMEIREAGTRQRPPSSQLDFSTRPASSALSKIHRQSGETFLTRSNRESYTSNRTVKSQVTDVGTQTNAGETPQTSPSPSPSEDVQERASFEQSFATKHTDKDDEIDYTTVDLTPLKQLSQPPLHESDIMTQSISEEPSQPEEQARMEEHDPTKLGPPSIHDDFDRASKASGASSIYEDPLSGSSDSEMDNDDDADDEDDLDEEEPVVYEVAAVQPARTQVMASRMIQAKGNVVTIPKRIPPPLPARSPARSSRNGKNDMGGDVSALRSPLHQSFSEADLATDENNDGRSVGSIDEAVAAKVESESAGLTRSQSDAGARPRPPTGSSEKPADKPEILDSATAEATYESASELSPVRIEISRVDTLPTENDLAENPEPQRPLPDAQVIETTDAKKDISTAALVDETEYTSDPHRKDADSINTATATDYRSSPEASRHTTPSSERPSSPHSHSEDETLIKKPAKEEFPAAFEIDEKHEAAVTKTQQQQLEGSKV